MRSLLAATLLLLSTGIARAEDAPSAALTELRGGLEAHLLVEPRAAALPQSAADAAREALATRAFGRRGLERSAASKLDRGAASRAVDALPAQAAQAAVEATRGAPRGPGSEVSAAANAEARAAAGQAAAQRGRDRATAPPGTGGRPPVTPGRGGRP